MESLPTGKKIQCLFCDITFSRHKLTGKTNCAVHLICAHYQNVKDKLVSEYGSKFDESFQCRNCKEVSKDEPSLIMHTLMLCSKSIFRFDDLMHSQARSTPRYQSRNQYAKTENKRIIRNKNILKKLNLLKLK